MKTLVLLLALFGPGCRAQNIFGSLFGSGGLLEDDDGSGGEIKKGQLL